MHLCFFDFVQDVLNKVKMQNIQAVFISIFLSAKLLQKSEMRKDIVIELSYKGFS